VATRQILPGDEILAVNSAKDPESMRREVSQTRLLKLSGRRGPNHFEEFYPWCSQLVPVMVLTPSFTPAQPLGSNATNIEEKLVSFDFTAQPQSQEEDKACRHVWYPDVRSSAANTQR